MKIIREFTNETQKIIQEEDDADVLIVITVLQKAITETSGATREKETLSTYVTEVRFLTGRPFGFPCFN